MPWIATVEHFKGHHRIDRTPAPERPPGWSQVMGVLHGHSFSEAGTSGGNCRIASHE